MDHKLQSISLNEGWQYQWGKPESRGPNAPWYTSQPPPTNIHLDLLHNSAIPDPFEAKNEDLVQWVGEQAWTYQTSFSLPRDVFQKPNVKVTLVFEGLDTFATVTLNDREILRSNNMFLYHRVEITEDLMELNGDTYDSQTLRLTFDPAEKLGGEEVEKHKDHSWFSFNSGVSRLAVRKAQYHYGWDWGPKLMTCGPWKPISLEIYEARIVDLSVLTRLAADRTYAELDISIDVEGKAKHAKVEIQRNGQTVASRTLDIRGSSLFTTLKLDNPDLWWPFTFGAQALYTASVALHSHENSEHVLDTSRKQFGIRKVELVRRPLDGEEGESFFFKVNDTPIFAAGSCWIPADSLLPRVSPEKYRDWVALAKESNQVMIRVWGGGIYEHDAFYDACDELGLLVWQDFMFACGIYPAYPEMEASVRIEAEQNVRRLRHHPSIVIWCGNNEDYVIPLLGSMEYDAEEKDAEKIRQSSFPGRYMYEHLLPAICNELVPDVPYWPGSPFGGSMVNSQTEGDIHQWHVWHLEKFPYQDFPQLAGRFVSEFGMQSVPSIRTCRSYFPPGDKLAARCYATDEYMTWHNKAEGAQETLTQYCTDNISHNKMSLLDYIYSTQLIQSEALSTAYRSWRRLWSGPGKEYCAGALVWQLNDCWPVTSWAIADYHLQPKMAFWAVKRENNPITAGLARVQSGKSMILEAWASNLTLKEVSVKVQVTAWNVVSGDQVWNITLHEEFRLPENQSTELGSLDLAMLAIPVKSESGNRYRNLVFAIYIFPLTASSDHSRSSNDAELPSLVHHINFHEPLREVPLQYVPDSVTAKIVLQDGKTFVELRALRPTKGVFVETVNNADIKWADNGVDLVPGQVTRLGVLGLNVGDEHLLKISWLRGDGSPPETDLKVKATL